MIVAGDEPGGRAPGARRRARRGPRPRSPRSSAQPARRAPTRGPQWPMIVLRTPKGWTGPKEVDGLPVEGTWRSHQVPVTDVREQPRPPADRSRTGCAATGAEELFDERRDAWCPSSPSCRRGRAADEREPARQRRRAAAGPRLPGLPRLRGRGPSAGHDLQRGDPRARRASSGTSIAREPDGTSASSGPTRRPRTGSTPSSR